MRIRFSPYVEGDSLTIEGNNIRDNVGAGIRMENSSSPHVVGNNIISGNRWGIYLYGYGGKPLPTITYNQIFDNTDGSSLRNLYTNYYLNASDIIIDATHNWWGTDNASVIAGGISTNTLPWIEFTPFLDGPEGEDVVGNYLRGTVDTSLSLAGLIYEVIGDLTVSETETWTIEAGAELIFLSDYLFTVNGALQVLGEDGQEVIFRSSDGGNNDWPGIEITDLSDGTSEIGHAVIQNAVVGVDVTGSDVNVSNSEITSYYTAGLSYDNAGGSIEHNVINRNYDTTGIYSYGIRLNEASPHIAGNTVQANLYGIYIPNDSSPVINGMNVITGNRYGLYVYGNNSQEDHNPRPVVNENNIYNNVNSAGTSTRNYYTTGSFYEGETLTLDATNNWWGTNVPDEINASIRDRNDVGSLPFVNYIPFWDGAGGGEPADDYLIGPIDTSQPLSSGIYQVIGDIVVQEGETWTINPGAELVFLADYSFTVNGAVQMNGTNEQRVIIRSADGELGDWSGIEITELSNGTSVIDNAVIQNAEIGVRVVGTNADIRNCDIVRYSATGISYESNANRSLRADGTISNNLINRQDESGRYGNGIYIINSSPHIQGNTIQGNGMGVFVNMDSSPLIDGHNVISENRTGLYLGANHLIAGNDPHPVVTGNDIFNNINQGNPYNVSTTYFFDPSIPIHAELNWWGTIDPVEIHATIHDSRGLVDSQFPLVNFTPFLDGPDGEEVQGEYLYGPVDTSQPLPMGLYQVVGNITVPEEETWQIEAGAVLLFLDTYSLKVNGTIEVNGTGSAPVTFRSDKGGDYDWPGIEITNLSNGDSVIDHAIVENASIGIKVDGTNADITNSTISNFGSHGVYYDNGADGTISGNSIDSQNARNSRGGHGIYLAGSSPVIQGNTIRRCRNGIFASHSESVITNGNNISGNMYGLYVVGDDRVLFPVVTYNAIHDNFDTDNGSNGTLLNYYVEYVGDDNRVYLTATHNYWGSTDPGVIGLSIRDYGHNSQPNLPVVHFTPFLDGPGGNPVDGTYLTGFIDTTQTLPQDSYQITSDILVAEGVTWTVPAGTEFIFTEEYALVVHGTIEIQGEENNEVMLDTDFGGGVFPWYGGINLIGPESVGHIQHAVIKNAYTGVKAEGSAEVIVSDCKIWNYADRPGHMVTGITFIEVQSGVIERNLIQQFQYSGEVYGTGYMSDTGMWIKDSNNIVINENFISNNYTGMMISGSTNTSITNNKVSLNMVGIQPAYCDPEISGNEIIENRNGIKIGNSASPYIHENTISDNNTGLWIHGNDALVDPQYFDYPDPLIRRNNIFNNNVNCSIDDFHQDEFVDARENWWGSRDITEIFHSFNSSRTVLFMPFLDSPNGEPIQGNFLFGDITEDRTLNGDTVYEVNSNVRVRSGATLTIEAGATLIMQEGSWLTISEGANLVVNGTLDNRVIFTHSSTPFVLGTAVQIASVDSNATINYAHFENFSWGMEIFSGHVDILNSVFFNCTFGAQYHGPARNGGLPCTGLVNGNQFINCESIGVSVGPHPINITNNIFTKDDSGGIAISATWEDESIIISGNVFNGYSHAIRLYIEYPTGPGPQINNNDFFNTMWEINQEQFTFMLLDKDMVEHRWMCLICRATGLREEKLLFRKTPMMAVLL